jgi:hypothetical protein
MGNVWEAHKKGASQDRHGIDEGLSRDRRGVIAETSRGHYPSLVPWCLFNKCSAVKSLRQIEVRQYKYSVLNYG